VLLHRANRQGQLARLTRFLTHCCVSTADKCGRAELAICGLDSPKQPKPLGGLVIL